MKILLYFFARYLLAPLFVAVMIFVLTGIKTIKSKLSLKKLIIFILLASIAVSLPSLFGFLKNEYVWGGLTFTILSYILLGALFCKLSTSDLFGAIGVVFYFPLLEAFRLYPRGCFMCIFNGGCKNYEQVTGMKFYEYRNL